MALTDTDILLKLGSCDLLSFFSDAISVARSDVRILRAALFYLEKNKTELAENYTMPGVERALKFAQESGTIEDVGYAENAYFELVNVEKIDPGEAVLFAGAVDDPGALIVTGDKNSLRALASTPEVKSIADQLCRRVICFEDLLLRIKESIGYTEFRDRVVPVCTCDDVLDRVVFRKAMATPEQHVNEALSSYVRQLQAKTGLLWRQ